MTDRLSISERSALMGKVRQKNTKPEITLRHALHKLGLRYRLHVSDLPGSPDLVFPKYRTAVFVHGCFWHRHKNCRLSSTPSTNSEFWRKKFSVNVDRDKKKEDELLALGWKVYVIWQCDLATEDKANEVAIRLAHEIRSNQNIKFPV